MNKVIYQIELEEEQYRVVQMNEADTVVEVFRNKEWEPTDDFDALKVLNYAVCIFHDVVEAVQKAQAAPNLMEALELLSFAVDCSPKGL